MIGRQQKRKAELLLEWFRENQREMPWRKTKDPYCIWVSEVMLQQTQVATVIPFYLRFIDQFPTISALAAATLEEVHTYWQGLGYYKRGENLWKGAKLIEERWQGQFPKDPRLVKEIPGIGPYTLGAVCSIAYGLPLPAVDGNVMRVMSRWYRISEDIGVAKHRKIFEEKVIENMPQDAGSFNQALMELGAMVCTPSNPSCEKCPVNQYCEAHQYGVEDAFPVKLKKIKPIEERHYALIVEKEGKMGLVKRPSEGLLANLWGLPMLSEEQWKENTWEDLEMIKLEPVTHVFTHRKWLLQPIVLKWGGKTEQKLREQFGEESKLTFIDHEALKDLPIATAFKKVMRKIQVVL